MPQQGCGVVLSLFFQSTQRMSNLIQAELRGNERMKSDVVSENDKKGNRIEKEEKICII
jgi:hypothetical protein